MKDICIRKRQRAWRIIEEHKLPVRIARSGRYIFILGELF
jgi:hypothetical protein